MTDRRPGELTPDQARNLGVDSAWLYREFKNNVIEYTLYYWLDGVRRRVDFELTQDFFDDLEEGQSAEDAAVAVTRSVIQADLESINSE